MITCRYLMESGILDKAKLLSGSKGLDERVSWIYAKHTKDITPWVEGGEFLLVSGYEADFNEDELLKLVEESAENKISGLLVEGGVNFKSIPESVIEASERNNIPLFFAKGLISFLDISRQVSTLILNSESKRNTDLIDKILDLSQDRIKLERVLYKDNISLNSKFIVASFRVVDKDRNMPNLEEGQPDIMLKLARTLQRHTGDIFQKLGLEEVYRIRASRIDFLLYGQREGDLYRLLDELTKVNMIINNKQDKYEFYLSYSGLIDDSMDIAGGFKEAYFTSDLIYKGIFKDLAMGFDEINSYQLIYYIEDKKKLMALRDKFLKDLYEVDRDGSSMLMETLREFLYQNGNMVQTSKKLIIHRNTLAYRLDRIESFTGLDLDDYDTRRDLSNAFMIMDYLEFPR